uniref:TNFR-Cys domain-containing protein n=1 Tax=Eptatretus burgeri TaxID=7764 RepID=A0A8C4NKZ5_EPTBU
MDAQWLSLILFITGSCYGKESSSLCPPNQFLHPDGICCKFCGIGTYLDKACLSAGTEPLCFACEKETYLDKPDNMTICKRCHQCDLESEIEERECDVDYDRQCVCRKGFQRKGNKCESLFSLTSSTSTASRPWWPWFAVFIGFFLMLLISSFVRRRFCPQCVCFSFLKKGLPTRRSLINIFPGSLSHSQVDWSATSASVVGKKVNFPRRFSFKSDDPEEAKGLMDSSKETEENTISPKFIRTMSLNRNTAPLQNRPLQNIRTPTSTIFPQQVHFSNEMFREGRQVQTCPAVPTSHAPPLTAVFPRVTSPTNSQENDHKL